MKEEEAAVVDILLANLKVDRQNWVEPFRLDDLPNLFQIGAAAIVVPANEAPALEGQL